MAHKELQIVKGLVIRSTAWLGGDFNIHHSLFAIPLVS